ncbi:Wzt carbohydrate-binding domain-containing protein [Rhodopseudomonas palustris]|uniref:Wzt carbohydrate-binding domain-containing protein n=1 Tax=Rhodopseudomonas palustris TaxID=1076 RepID=UPI0023ECF4ED|nr:Wzt carbohydrate-binding domain-containing protein [Rhodopseudomonas palustris]
MGAPRTPICGVENDKSHTIAISVVATDDNRNVSGGYNIKPGNGAVVYGTSSSVQGHFFDFLAGESITCRLAASPELALGTSYLSIDAAEPPTPVDEIHNYATIDFVHDALRFMVGSRGTSESRISKLN